MLSIESQTTARSCPQKDSCGPWFAGKVLAEIAATLRQLGADHDLLAVATALEFAGDIASKCVEVDALPCLVLFYGTGHKSHHHKVWNWAGQECLVAANRLRKNQCVSVRIPSISTIIKWTNERDLHCGVWVRQRMAILRVLCWYALIWSNLYFTILLGCQLGYVQCVYINYTQLCLFFRPGLAVKTPGWLQRLARWAPVCSGQLNCCFVYLNSSIFPSVNRKIIEMSYGVTVWNVTQYLLN